MRISKPVRIERTYVQKIHAKPHEVFPLLCPVREAEWVEGWDPMVVYSQSGFAEPDCIFMTMDSGVPSVWVITIRDPESFRLQMVKVTPGMTVGKITIHLKESGDGITEARVTYMYTALSDEGERFVSGYTEEFYTRFMAYWEKTLNHYLRPRSNSDASEQEIVP